VAKASRSRSKPSRNGVVVQAGLRTWSRRVGTSIRIETIDRDCQRRMLMTETTDAERANADIAEAINTHPLVLFMKGTSERPQCGFSAAVVWVLRHYDVPVHTIDVLADPAIRQAIKTYSDWPTIPQLYLNGTFVGGCDIVREMHGTGELAELIAASGARALA
jgi:monothiol glutaredoxin